MASDKSFFKGAMILTAAGVIGKVLGAMYRIPFNRIVGAEGAGLYALSYSLYNILFALSTAGIPLAVSKLVAVSEERREHGESIRLFRLTLLVLGAFGLSLALFVFLRAEWLAVVLFNEPRVALSLQALAPAMFFSCLMASFRGFFQGKRQMIPTALSQILEQFFRVGTILLAVFFVAGLPLTEIVAMASFGSSVGQIVSFSFLLVVFVLYMVRTRPKNEQPVLVQRSNGDIVRELLYLAIPISIGALALPILSFIDSTVSLFRLETAAGFTHTEAVIQNGYLGNSAMPIINLPFIITTAVAASLLPTIAESYEQKDDANIQANIRATLQLTMILMLPASAGLALLGTPICILLYNQYDAGVAMSALAFTVLAVGLYQVSGSALQGLGRVLIPMQSLLLAVLLKIGLSWLLVGIPGVGVAGAGVATVLAFSVAAAHNIFRLSRLVGTAWFSAKQLVLKPLASTVAMAVLVLIVYEAVLYLAASSSLAAVCAIAAGGSGYFVVLFLIGGIEAEVLQKIPKVGTKLAARFGGKNA